MSNRSSANITRENISQDNVLLVCNMAETNSEDIWFLDFGCINHMTGNIALFFALDQSVQSQVTLGTDSKIFVMGKGEVKIFTKKGEKKTIADVYYVPRMKCNLLSIGQLVQKGYNVFFENDVPKDENWLWHLRFGHLNFGGLNLLSRK